MKKRKLSHVCLLAFVLMFACAHSVFAWNEYYQNVKLSINKSNIALVDLFSFIEQNSEYLFFYKDADVKNVNISISAKNKTVNQILNSALEHTKLTYSISGRNVNIIKKQMRIYNIENTKV